MRFKKVSSASRERLIQSETSFCKEGSHILEANPSNDSEDKKKSYGSQAYLEERPVPAVSISNNISVPESRFTIARIACGISLCFIGFMLLVGGISANSVQSGSGRESSKLLEKMYIGLFSASPCVILAGIALALPPMMRGQIKAPWTPLPSAGPFTSAAKKDKAKVELFVTNLRDNSSRGDQSIELGQLTNSTFITQTHIERQTSTSSRQL